MKVLIIDNYDSFTFNLYQYIGELLEEKRKSFHIDVVRNNAISLEDIRKRNYERIIISPGPGDPRIREYFGVCAEVLTDIGKCVPILGVCLGMQGMAYYFGGAITKARMPMHGKTSYITHEENGIFLGIPQHIAVMRYHSLIVEKNTLPACLKITALSHDTHEIMGLTHTTYPIAGIQFHPESFATDAGKLLLSNFLFANTL